ncbi:MAG: putative metal-binding motif-containing protein [Sandaracinus sp.]|nr:putative metal-binding motif-containing protein [Sandaracinus sp.]MCB9610855.1 putative metal-binding motif-containing protein [Sandaracinus sp.]MCB9623914.1 putative metal-binding motif-containing protein [Sandaracinus sp.]
MRALFLGLLLALTGCSLMGLDETAATPCAVSPTASTDFTDAHATCARELGGAPLGDCEAWVCALRIDDEVFCVVGAPDRDGDGVGDAMCIPEGDERPRDCDDADAAVAGGKTERCDGRDNDCDGHVDEGLLQRGTPLRVDEADGSAGQVAFTDDGALLRRSVAGEQALMLWTRGSAPRRVGDLTLYDPLAASDDPGLAVARFGSAHVGVFARNLAGCARTLVPAQLEGSSATSTSLDLGLPDTSGADCGSARSEPQRAPGVASLGRRSVFAWLASASGGGPVRVVGGNDTDGLTLAGSATELGEATGALAMLPLVEENLVLLAVPRAAATEIYAMTLAANGAVTIGERLLSLDGAAGDLALAAGPLTDGSRTLALASRSGEGRGARVTLQRLVLAAGALTAGEATSVGDAEGQGMPSVTWSETPRGWIVVWSERNAELRARLLGATEGTSGDALTLLGASDLGDGAELRFGSSLAAAETGFVVLTHASGGASTGLHEIALGCSAE